MQEPQRRVSLFVCPVAAPPRGFTILVLSTAVPRPLPPMRAVQRSIQACTSAGSRYCRTIMLQRDFVNHMLLRSKSHSIVSATPTTLCLCTSTAEMMSSSCSLPKTSDIAIWSCKSVSESAW
jgi:hypothetical protein